MTITGPTWVYHRTEPARIVNTQAALDALGEGWDDTPAAFYEPVKPAAKTREKAKE